MLDTQGTLVALDREAVRRAVEEMATRGLRVLGCARRHVDDVHGRLDVARVKGQFRKVVQ